MHYVATAGIKEICEMKTNNVCMYWPGKWSCTWVKMYVVCVVVAVNGNCC